MHLAEQRRPDIIELKLITEADQVRLIQAKDQTLPQLNAVAQYQWNGLTGVMPNGEDLSTKPGQYTELVGGRELLGAAGASPGAGQGTLSRNS